MIRRLFLLLAALPFFVGPEAIAQSDYANRRSLEGVKSTGYHRVPLTPEILTRIQPSFADLRLYRQDASDQALSEISYLLEVPAGYVSRKDRPIKMLNERSKGTERIQVIRRESEEKANRISVQMNEKSYDVRLSLESSNNRLNWTTVAENIRIRALHDDQVDFEANEFRFKDNGEKFFRLKVNDPSVEITDVKLWYVREGSGKTQPYAIKSEQNEIVGDTKDTEMIIQLTGRYPVSEVELNIGTGGDYVRPVEISYLAKDQEATSGSDWKKFDNGVLSNLSSANFSAKPVFAYAIRIEIGNQYDLPLDIRSVRIAGPAYALIADLEATGGYALYYGNKQASKPSYKMSISQRKLPKDIVPARLGSEGSVPDELVAVGGSKSRDVASSDPDKDGTEDAELEEADAETGEAGTDPSATRSSKQKPDFLLWGGLGAVLALIVFLVIRRRRANQLYD